MTQKKNVLILDDEVDICLLLSLQIKRLGNCEVRYVHALAELPPLLQEFTPDLVLLDVNLPDGSGLSVVPDLRAAHPKVHIIVISAYGELLQGKEVEALDLKHIVPKPFSDGSLLELVTGLLESEDNDLPSAASGDTLQT